MRTATLLVGLLLVLTLPVIAAPPAPPSPNVQRLIEAGDAAYSRSDFQEALRLYGEALRTAITARDPAGQCAALYELSGTSRDLGENRKAIETGEQALPLARALNDVRRQAELHSRIGAACTADGRPEAALDHHQKALAIYRRLKDNEWIGASLANIGAVYWHTGNPREALVWFRRALPIQQSAGDRQGAALTLSNMGSAFYHLGEWERSLEYLRRALPLQREAGDRVNEAITLNGIGVIAMERGRHAEALLSAREALPIFRELQNKPAEAVTLNTIGRAHYALGQPHAGLQALERAAVLAAETENRMAEAVTANNLSWIYFGLARPEIAQDYGKRALELLRATGDRRNTAMALSNLGALYQMQHDYPGAVQAYQECRTLLRTVGDRHAEATALNNLGMAYQQMGRADDAMRCFRQALPLRRAVKHRGGEAATLTNLGTLHEKRGSFALALRYHREARRLLAAEKDTLGEAAVLGNLAAAERSLGRRAQALRYAREALELLEGNRSILGNLAEFKASVLEDNLSLYHNYIEMLVEKGDPAGAFKWVERSKGRLLLDRIAAGKVDPTRRLAPADRARDRELLAKVAAADQRLHAARQAPTRNAEEEALLRERLLGDERELTRFRDLLQARYPAAAGVLTARTETLGDLGAWLPEDTALLQYLVHASGPVFLFCVTTSGGRAVTSVHRLPVTRASLAEQAGRLAAACGRGSEPARGVRLADTGPLSYLSHAEALYRSLIRPAEGRLRDKKRLILCPDGPLWGAPLHLLSRVPTHTGSDAPASLLDEYEVVYAYSATSAHAALLADAASRNSRPSGSILVAADPDYDPPAAPAAAEAASAEKGTPLAPAVTGEPPSRLRLERLPGAAAEARALKELFTDAEVRTGSEVREESIKEALGRYRYLHFATHGLLNGTAPLMSSLAFSRPPEGAEEDGFLYARELAELDLKAELVVLSACDTGRGEVRSGEGIIGLSWALFAAGTPSQVVSQWSVADESTALLMREFYRGLRNGAPRGAALRSAALALRREPRYRHPYYWAPFILMGDWR